VAECDQHSQEIDQLTKNIAANKRLLAERKHQFALLTSELEKAETNVDLLTMQLQQINTVCYDQVERYSCAFCGTVFLNVCIE
jgi:hypothetical protein